MKFDPPRLSIGGLSGRVYVTTHGRITGERDGRELIESTVKYDVTEQFDALAKERFAGPDPSKCGSPEHAEPEAVGPPNPTPEGGEL